MKEATRAELHNTKRSRRAERGRWGKSASTAIATCLLVILCCSLFGTFLSSAHSNRDEAPVNFKYYKSITIAHGDTLWGIAEKYMTDDYDSVEEYVYALKKMNNLNGDTIKAGDKIMIAYNNTHFLK